MVSRRSAGVVGRGREERSRLRAKAAKESSCTRVVVLHARAVHVFADSATKAFNFISDAIVSIAR
jgi:hypothetical protein